MPLDPEGVSYAVSDAVWYDDGHSDDWQHGTVQGFPGVPGNTARIQPDGGGSVVGINLPLIHVGKPKDPPDHP